ncbi:MAG: gliding motility-associated C-terminal domain-containing protein, partial [Cyclobacteriaceae bacterium]
MKKILLTFLLLIAFPVMASHIVGGEFELIHLTGNSYRLNLILYFDVLNGNPGAQDPFADVRIFRKRDNFIMANQIRLTFDREERVSYTQPACSKGEIVTKKLYYTTTITLPPEQYNDPQGYYVAWERCCRNYSITNIFSNAPPSSQFAGQTFYLEFPPVVKDGVPFINNSPRLFPPLNDYGCINKPYYVDFAGTDDDKDSLVYSLVAPLNTFSGDALPPGNLPRPGPYNP